MINCSSNPEISTFDLAPPSSDLGLWTNLGPWTLDLGPIDE